MSRDSLISAAKALGLNKSLEPKLPTKKIRFERMTFSQEELDGIMREFADALESGDSERLAIARAKMQSFHRNKP